MISDTNGFDDKSFNQTSLKGMTDAKSELGFETAQVQSRAATDYAKNIQSMVDADCNMIVTVVSCWAMTPWPRLRRILT
jgi:basic membrane protein A